MSQTRKLARSVARANMTSAGMHRLNRPYKKGSPSPFSMRWRNYAHPSAEARRKAAEWLKTKATRKAKREAARKERAV